MMSFGKPTRAKNAMFAVFGFICSGVVFLSWATFDGIPPRSALRVASGPVSRVENGRYAITFTLAGVPGSFDYPSKGNAMALVYDTLSRPDHPVVTVLYDPGSDGDARRASDIPRDVYELSIAGEPFRSHEEIAAAWQSDENAGLWLSVILALGSLYLASLALRDRGRNG